MAQNSIDNLKSALYIATEDTNKAKLLDTLSQYYTWSFADTSVIYARQQLQLAKKLNFKSGEARGTSNLLYALTVLGDYTNALDFGYKSLALYKEANDTFGIAYVYGGLGVCYRELGDYKKGIQLLQETIKLFYSVHNEEWIAIAEGVLSSVYEKNNQLDSALFYANKCYKVVGDNWSGVLLPLGDIHTKLGHNEEAIEFYRKSISFALLANSQTNILDAYNGIAQVYVNERKTDSAIYYAKETLAQQWGKAYPIGLLRSTTLLSYIYSTQNKSDSSVKYLKLTISLKDSLFNQQKTREAQNFAFNEQLHQQELQQAVEQSQLKYKNRLNISFLGGGALILLLVAAGLWRRNVFKRQSIALLQKQKGEVQSTLTQLKSTQAQLIQSEKMASLGELTAGIAHEIQNPLNFVNNFSELNDELLEEINTETSLEEIKFLIVDIKQNNEKINFHGKRADAIVKGMLQHSRQTKGVKEWTDINALCDEYLRLSYHGLRAKDKNFNADLKTDFDETIGKIIIVPQDMGRVLLNLFNNAFYAVNEKKKTGGEDYKPLVSVSTKKTNDIIKIIVTDNGSGIPSLIIDKIFQPFFTTKPTGQGTGLGLSLSYDIITKVHDGSMKVESNEEGCSFIIQLADK